MVVRDSVISQQDATWTQLPSVVQGNMEEAKACLDAPYAYSTQQRKWVCILCRISNAESAVVCADCARTYLQLPVLNLEAVVDWVHGSVEVIRVVFVFFSAIAQLVVALSPAGGIDR